jgi:hypothetical protein
MSRFFSVWDPASCIDEPPFRYFTLTDGMGLSVMTRICADHRQTGIRDGLTRATPTFKFSQVLNTAIIPIPNHFDRFYQGGQITVRNTALGLNPRDDPIEAVNRLRRGQSAPKQSLGTIENINKLHVPRVRKI